MALRERISELLSLPENGANAPSIEAIETTLTDGYAAALALDAERWRIRRRLGEVGPNDADEHARLSERLEIADSELAGLRPLLRSLHARARTARRGRRAPVG
jgi:hypothetical protein